MDQMNMAITHSMMNAGMQGALSSATIGQGILSTAAQQAPPWVRKEETLYAANGLTIITRYEKAENGWIVMVAQHEGERYKRYIATTLEDAHKLVSAYIAAERLER